MNNDSSPNNELSDNQIVLINNLRSFLVKNYIKNYSINNPIATDIDNFITYLSSSYLISEITGLKSDTPMGLLDLYKNHLINWPNPLSKDFVDKRYSLLKLLLAPGEMH